MKRTVIRLGSVFAVKVDDHTKKYFQFVAVDQTQLNSEVICVFKKAYPLDANPDLREVLRGEIEFFAHVVIRWGIRLDLWEKVGESKDMVKVDVFFRDSQDYGNPSVRRSDKWRVWKINEPFTHVGKLATEYHNSEIGVIIAPSNIVQRMRTGQYDFFYPEF